MHGLKRLTCKTVGGNTKAKLRFPPPPEDAYRTTFLKPGNRFRTTICVRAFTSSLNNSCVIFIPTAMLVKKGLQAMPALVDIGLGQHFYA